jgi:transcriptional antiterminator NusG
MSDTDTDTNEPQTDITDPALDTPAPDADAVTDDDSAAAEAVADEAPGSALDDATDVGDAVDEAPEADAAELEEAPEAAAEAEAVVDEAPEADAAEAEAAVDEPPEAAATEAEAAVDEAPETVAAPAADEAGDGAAEAVGDEAPGAGPDEAADVVDAVDGAEAVVDDEPPEAAPAAAEAEAVVDEAPEVEAEPAANGQAAVDESAEAVGGEVITDEELLARPPAESPYDRPGRWFVVHTQSGYEKKVKQNLEARIVSMNAEDAIYEVVIPMEDYVDFRNGKRIVAQRKMFPGYLLVRAALDDQAWFVIRNTPGVTGFVGQGAKPSPLPRRDVESFLIPKGGTEEQVAQRAKPRLEYEIGETVRVREGPFADFSGEVIELNEDQLKLKVLVNIFGRETPVELEFSKVAKL